MLDLLVDFLPRRFPDRFKRTSDNELQNLATGDVFKLDHPDLDPLEVCSLLVQVHHLPELGSCHRDAD